MQLDGAKFYQALFIGYLFFIWRYCTKLDLRAGFWNDFVNYFISSEEGVKSVHNFNKYSLEFIKKCFIVAVSKKVRCH